MGRVSNKIARSSVLGRKLAAGLRSPANRAALRNGIAPAVEHRRILESIQPQLVVDVGANRGQFSLAVRAAHPATHIVAFEPLPDAHAMLLATFAGDEAFEGRPFALSQNEGEAVFHVSEKEDSSSLLAITDAQSSTFAGTGPSGTTTVQVSTLAKQFENSEIPDASLLKADVQGAELDVLMGAGDLLTRFSHLYLELSLVEFYEAQALAGQVMTYLAERQFGLVDIGDLTRGAADQVVQADFLFENHG